MENDLKIARAALTHQLMVRCNGGLGNQIFQYAAGLYFTKRALRSLQIIRPPDPRKNEGQKFPRPFQLDMITSDLNIRSATRRDRLFLSEKSTIRLLRKELEDVWRTRTLEESAPYRFFPDLVDNVSARDVYLVGYWQAAGYAEAIADELRSSLNLCTILQKRNQDYEESIRALTCPVSIHIRVGDYAVHTSSTTNGSGEVSWVLQSSYFQNAIAQIQNLLPEASFIVFSDDQVSAREIISGAPVSLWIEGNSTGNAYEDLRLMSCCKHHIIANSTFSWWGAWLNPSREKIVVAPKYWHNTHRSFFPDLYPSGWILLDNLT